MLINFSVISHWLNDSAEAKARAGFASGRFGGFHVEEEGAGRFAGGEAVAIQQGDKAVHPPGILGGDLPRDFRMVEGVTAQASWMARNWPESVLSFTSA